MESECSKFPKVSRTCLSILPDRNNTLDGLDIIIICSFFTSVLADGFSLEFEWQQVSLSLLDSPQYSGRSLLLLLSWFFTSELANGFLQEFE